LEYIIFLLWATIPVFLNIFTEESVVRFRYRFEKLNDQRSFLLGPGTNILMSAIKWKAFTTEIGFSSNWPVGDI